MDVWGLYFENVSRSPERIPPGLQQFGNTAVIVRSSASHTIAG
jgi:hypothetical protein